VKVHTQRAAVGTAQSRRLEGACSAENTVRRELRYPTSRAHPSTHSTHHQRKCTTRSTLSTLGLGLTREAILGLG
jgi:hypothetical protein